MKRPGGPGQGCARAHGLLAGACLFIAAVPAHAVEPSVCEGRIAEKWIAENFADTDLVSGDFQGRVELESPVWVRNASGSNARYAFSLLEAREPADPRAAFTNVRISNLRSKNSFGGGIKTHRGSPGMQLFLSNVVIEPNWPDWDSYGKTNYDGIVLDSAAAFFAQNLKISNWNADSAIDNKALVSQLSRVEISGPGHRPLRYWKPGPHYLVDTTIDSINASALIWFDDCDSVTLKVYRSRFNGLDRLNEDALSCGSGEDPKIVYLEHDPRKTGEMHPMFGVCAPER